MHVWRIEEYGDYHHLRLASADRGEVPPGHVRIAVEASGLNYADLLMIAGEYQVRPGLPLTPGFECAGRILEVGDGVTSFTPGARVMACVWEGGMGRS